MDGEDNLALALIRDGNGTRSFDTLMRYRGSALAEFFRALRTLQALQAEAAELPQPRNEPKSRAKPGQSGSRPAAEAGLTPPAASPPSPRSTRRAHRNEPESRADAGLPPPDRPGRRAA